MATSDVPSDLRPVVLLGIPQQVAKADAVGLNGVFGELNVGLNVLLYQRGEGQGSWF